MPFDLAGLIVIARMAAICLAPVAFSGRSASSRRAEPLQGMKAGASIGRAKERICGALGASQPDSMIGQPRLEAGETVAGG
jgi:hypothetical protein